MTASTLTLVGATLVVLVRLWKAPTAPEPTGRMLSADLSATTGRRHRVLGESLGGWSASTVDMSRTAQRRKLTISGASAPVHDL